jgi:predicted nucleic acid-binding protein
MAKILDLNALDQPILEVKLRDKARTIFRLTTPTTKLVEKFIVAKAEVSEVASTRDADKIKALYELTAELISCNADYITVSAEELRDTYHLTFADLVVIFAAYLDFIKEFNDAKN